MCCLGQDVYVQLLVEEGNGKPPLLICTSKVNDGTSEIATSSRTFIKGQSNLHHHHICNDTHHHHHHKWSALRQVLLRQPTPPSFSVFFLAFHPFIISFLNVINHTFPWSSPTPLSRHSSFQNNF